LRVGLDEALANVGRGEANEASPHPQHWMNWANAEKRTPCLGKGAVAAAAAAGEEAPLQTTSAAEEDIFNFLGGEVEAAPFLTFFWAVSSTLCRTSYRYNSESGRGLRRETCGFFSSTASVTLMSALTHARKLELSPAASSFDSSATTASLHKTLDETRHAAPRQWRRK
jgi:hypothetical protein